MSVTTAILLMFDIHPHPATTHTLLQKKLFSMGKTGNMELLSVNPMSTSADLRNKKLKKNDHNTLNLILRHFILTFAVMLTL